MKDINQVKTNILTALSFAYKYKQVQAVECESQALEAVYKKLANEYKSTYDGIISGEIVIEIKDL